MWVVEQLPLAPLRDADSLPGGLQHGGLLPHGIAAAAQPSAAAARPGEGGHAAPEALCHQVRSALTHTAIRSGLLSHTLPSGQVCSHTHCHQVRSALTHTATRSGLLSHTLQPPGPHGTQASQKTTSKWHTTFIMWLMPSLNCQLHRCQIDLLFVIVGFLKETGWSISCASLRAFVSHY